jgi:hypothetical protein
LSALEPVLVATHVKIRLVVVRFEKPRLTVEGTATGVAITERLSENLESSPVVRTRTFTDTPLVRPVITVPGVSGTPGVHSIKTADVLGRYQTLSVVVVKVSGRHDTLNWPADGVTRSSVTTAGFVVAWRTGDMGEHPKLLHALTDNA